MTPAGPDAAVFAERAARLRPRLYVTNSAIHNPTGASLSPLSRTACSRAAAAHDVAIARTRSSRTSSPSRPRALPSLDGLERVLRIGSFSKTLSASVRCGFIAARPEWIETLADLQIATQFGAASPLSAGLVHEVLADGGYRRHMESVRGRLAKARRDAARRLDGLGFRLWTEPRGGFGLWCEMPGAASAAELARSCAGRGVVLAPGDVFSPSGTAGSMMRFNAAQMRRPASGTRSSAGSRGPAGPLSPPPKASASPR